ncbi:MAG: response regulator [Bacteroidota bacterium]
MDCHEFRNLKGLRVLVVDDNYINRQLFSHILMQWQVSTDMAVDGVSAVAMLSNKTYDVVLMDLMMPELDGYEATYVIRSMQDPYYREVPIYAFSTNPDPDKIVACRMNGFITKSPLDKVELHTKLSAHLK